MFWPFAFFVPGMFYDRGFFVGDHGYHHCSRLRFHPFIAFGLVGNLWWFGWWAPFAGILGGFTLTLAIWLAVIMVDMLRDRYDPFMPRKLRPTVGALTTTSALLAVCLGTTGLLAVNGL